ncbi:MAG: AMP-binding protein [Spirochaetes bacterium]|nr:AMP-binding protein [Spirochaetota bacterium]
MHGGRSLSYADLGDAVAAARRLLAGRGIEFGDRVALIGENKPEWGITYLAVTSMGAVVVPILTDFSGDIIAMILEHSGAKGVVVSESMKAKVPAETAERFVTTIEELGASAIEAATGAGEAAAGGAPDGGGTDPAARPQETDLASILYTSGTTGDPKGVMLTHRNIVQNVISCRSVADIGPDDRFLSVLPLAHSYECTVGFLLPVASGASVTYLGKPPTLTALLPALAEVHPTMMLTVPLIMEKLYQSRVKPVFAKNALTRALKHIAPLRKFVHRAAGKKAYEAFGGALRFYGIGGAPLTPDTERFLREAKFPYAIGYGLTETAPLIAGTDAADTKFRSTGPAIENVEIRIDRNAGDGVEGEVLVRGPNVMQGYYRNEEATKEILTEDGWLRTGDLASEDRDGYIYIRGRLKNMILGPSGENIYPGDLENVINEHELVVESLVFEWQGQLLARVHVDIEALKERLGEHAAHIASVQERADEILESLRKAVNARVSRHARLSRMVLEWEPFEKTPTRKIKRFLYTHLGEREGRRA